jgi:PAT family beta-lactamase induction signal transducer AmpG
MPGYFRRVRGAGTGKARLAPWRRALGVYADRRMLVIAGLGLVGGLALPLTLSTLTFRLAEAGLGKASIGAFALLGLSYGYKFVWAPLFDHVLAPGPLGRVGRRRGWLLLISVLLAASMVGLGIADPASSPRVFALLTLAVGFLGASWDIVADAYRIELLSETEQGAGAASVQGGYQLGMVAAGSGAVALSYFLPWPPILSALAALTLCGGLLVVVLGDEETRAQRIERRTVSAWEAIRLGARRGLVEPFADFARHRAWLALLAFALLYKFGDAITGAMANPFYVDLGFNALEIAGVTQALRTIVTLAGVFVGGLMVARYGLFGGLALGGVLQAVTNFLFVWQAHAGHDLRVLTVAIGADGFTGGLASAAFVAFLSNLCRPAFAATQYALLTSLMAQGRTYFAAGGGWLAAYTTWAQFFALSALLAIPGLALLAFLARAQRSSLGNGSGPSTRAQASAPPSTTSV